MASAKDLKVLPADVEKQILDIAREMQAGSVKRSSHLLNIAVSCYKYLVLRGESDSLRLQAAKAIVELPPVQARLGAMVKTVKEYHQHLHINGNGEDKAITERISGMLNGANGAQVIEILQEFSSETPDNPLKTNENP